MPTRRQSDPQVETVWMPEDNGAHGGINHYAANSRWSIADNEYSDLQNIIPMGQLMQQVPSNGPIITTLVSTAVWISAQTLNQATYLFCLGVNGGLYQVSLGGVITTIPGVFSSLTDIANWQGTQIIISDVNVAAVFAWNGVALTTVFTSQPAAFIAVYNARLWMANQSTVTFTAGGTYNSLGGDSGSFIITETDCPPPIRAMYPFGGSFYIWGYNWVQTLSGLFDSGTPAVVQFTKGTLTDEAGLYSKWSIVPYGYSIFYASLYGIWNLYGAQPQFTSENIGQFFEQSTLPQSSYSAAFGQVLGIPCLFWNFYSTLDNSYRVFGYTLQGESQPGQWFTLNGSNIKFITYGVNQTNGQQCVWGTDTAGNLFQLFAGTDNVSSVIHTKLWTLSGNRQRIKSIGRVGIEMVVDSATTVLLSISNENLQILQPLLQSVNPGQPFLWTNNGATFNWTNIGSPFVWTDSATQFTIMEFELPITVKRLGLNVTITGNGATVNSFGVEFTEEPADWGM